MGKFEKGKAVEVSIWMGQLSYKSERNVFLGTLEALGSCSVGAARIYFLL